ncbi:lysoplasmalogenase family protein [Clostridium ganghwense]|uniref:Lysoplasmalogenase family protein n=1 Tax=Clostridium ganghwense TaxID=312089 RepID=A0ABT4CLR0_9CLOT|nr:lysoplasmalogenase family protein [Clostridium ganghwense]MCY6369176.1 lysoplasmalogenase family protein [Clostridium ganghwense]
MLKKYINFKNTIILVIIFIYINFLIIDLQGGDPRLLKYVSILLCFVLVLLIGDRGIDKKDTILLQVALFFTTMADLNLVILKNFILGITAFCIVQIIYIIRHSRKIILNKSNFIVFLLESIVILGLVIMLNIPFYEDKALYIVASIYSILLITSVYMAFGTIKRGVYSKRNSYFIMNGMVLFLLCDINVGLYHIGKIQYISGLLVWFFYLPSQLLLSLSGYKMK